MYDPGCIGREISHPALVSRTYVSEHRDVVQFSDYSTGAKPACSTPVKLIQCAQLPVPKSLTPQLRQ